MKALRLYGGIAIILLISFFCLAYAGRTGKGGFGLFGLIFAAVGPIIWLWICTNLETGEFIQDSAKWIQEKDKKIEKQVANIYQAFNLKVGKELNPSYYSLCRFWEASELQGVERPASRDLLKGLMNFFFIDSESPFFGAMYAGLRDESKDDGKFFIAEASMILNIGIEKFEFGYILKIDLSIGEIMRIYFKGKDEAEKAALKLSILTKNSR